MVQHQPTRDTSCATTRLANVARETKRKIQWDQILEDTERQWKWLENARAFSIYTKDFATSTSPTTSSSSNSSKGNGNNNSYGVLSIGVVKGTLKELASILVAHSQAEYEQTMKALHEKEFKHGKYINNISEPILYDNDSDKNEPSLPVGLSVRSATYTRTGWLNRDDEWWYLDATSYDHENKKIEKLLTTLRPQDFDLPLNRMLMRGPHQVQDVICGYRMEQISPESVDEPCVERAGTSSLKVASVRVHFYGELVAPTHSQSNTFAIRLARPEVSTQATKHRLRQLAKNCDRFSVLVRRRRLGIQDLVDQKRVFLSKTPHCFTCGVSSQFIGKLCRVCGQTVCSDCSAKYDRDLYGKDGSVRVERVRVCDPCLARVESADYSNVENFKGIRHTAVVPDEEDNDVSKRGDPLKALLRDALLEAPSPTRKASVLNVIRCVLDQEKAAASPVGSTSTSKQETMLLSTPLSKDKEYIQALENLDSCVATSKIELCATSGRPYALDPRKPVGEPMVPALPPNELKRLQLIHDTGVLDYQGSWHELTIICEIAAKELNVFASCITVITDNEQVVIASSMPQFEKLRVKREDSLCQHTIMETKPLVVQHPEADIRFSRVATITGFEMRYYCGFPLLVGGGGDGGNDAVIGTLCCLNKSSTQITESQLATLQRLSQTAAKVVRLHGERQRNTTNVAQPA